ncbi:unannotated protein [freshwater metagenome]|uniref:Unannotated protein n=1 Tax=freshwater metagenome TaxID=449393 RepID=A0A6J7SVL5_9ZZZZ|nr:tRNA pseudouridine(38-40) synthase TruA [Actinomycetota bacterium]MSY07817.1 tRNA pseudouridine(38-40) synthase TruA [Actinomycetota bacterium]MSZ36667.1 tRNA pseudouridine(38-40) synthase TruA [Actinomycetota bacterium]MSZ99035.1 tRNA pseudouridine(38-40) synthase TruA [Actinomycetota bacterium]MTA69092.1 tRNA pseudouridine(38-40) synthase TruA [Actinomycetota bacterium]
MSTSEPATRRARLLVAYEGSYFNGFAVNEGVRTIAGVIGDALSLISRFPVHITGAGRTDAGVHGWGQVISCDLPVDIDLEHLPRRLTKMCAPGIVVRSAEWAVEDFHARFSAQWRHYRYTVLNDPVADPFLAASAWHVPERLDVQLMYLACDPLIGEHDFSAFCRKPKPVENEPTPSMFRLVTQAQWSEQVSERGSRLLRFEIRANAFCHQMVRSIVGTLVDVGLGKITPGSMSAILHSRVRTEAGQVAPAHGLCLWEVGYLEQIFE